MFSASIIQKWDDFTPMFTMLNDMLKNDIIFRRGPSTSLFAFIKMVQPSFPALLGSTEARFVRIKEHFL
jgi:hypothetical protein